MKLEGGMVMGGVARRIAAADISVMGHIGFAPHSIHCMGGHRVQGRKSGRGSDAVSGCSMMLGTRSCRCIRDRHRRRAAVTRRRNCGRSFDSNDWNWRRSCVRRPAARDARCARHSESFIPRFAKPFANLYQDSLVVAPTYARELWERQFAALEHCYREARRAE